MPSGSESLRSAGRGRLQLHGLVHDLIPDAQANDTAADSCATRSARRSTIRRLRNSAPKDHPIGTKRICVDTDYYTTSTATTSRWSMRARRRSSDLTDRPAHRRHRYELDVIVFATGFDAMTGALSSMDIAVGGMTLRQNGWRVRARTSAYDRGLSEPVHDHRARQPVGAEQHDGVDRAARRLDHRLHGVLRRTGWTHRADPGGEDEWVETATVAHTTLYPLANSWYMGANMPGSRTVHAVCRRGRDVSRDLRRDRRRGIRGLALSDQEAALAAE